jgi:hypothetical protein
MKTSWRKIIIFGMPFVAILLITSWFLFSIDSPPNRASAIRAIKQWARIDYFPVPESQLHIETLGSAFSREFIVTFSASPSDIQRWLVASPGPKSVTPTKDPNGWIHYSYEGGEGSLCGAVYVSPEGDKVRIRATWS